MSIEINMLNSMLKKYYAPTEKSYFIELTLEHDSQFKKVMNMNF